MTTDGNRNATVSKRIQNRKKAFTRNAEDMLDAVDQELLDKRCGSGSARCGLVHKWSFQFAVTGFDEEMVKL